MVIKLYGPYRSPFVRLAAAVLLEKQVPYELAEVDIANREHKSPEYLAKHPFGQVPYLDDDGFILYESRAICYYIASKYPNQGTPLLPTGLQANALHQQAVFVESFQFNAHAYQAAREIISKKKEGLAPDQDVVDKHIAELSAKLDVYDNILSKQKYLVGDEITLADFYHLPIGCVLVDIGQSIMESKPNVARWFKDVSSRESWVSTKPEEVKPTN